MYIILIGYMGSGKTTVGRIISLFLRNKFYDLDEIIHNWKNQDIHNIFFKNGENYFRTLETDILHFLRNIKKKIIISPGGGTTCNNIFFLKKSLLTFYLHLFSKEIFQRIRYQKYKRPLISSLSSDKLLYFIHKHLSNRIIYYNKLYYKLEIVSRFIEEIIYSINNQLSLIPYKYEFIKKFK